MAHHATEYAARNGGTRVDAPPHFRVHSSPLFKLDVKRKLVLVAAHTIFSIFSTDEETFANAQLRNCGKTCSTILHPGTGKHFRAKTSGHRGIKPLIHLIHPPVS